MRLRLWVLVAASFVFYGVSGLEVLLAFVIAILWGLHNRPPLRQMAKRIGHRRRGLGANGLGILFPEIRQSISSSESHLLTQSHAKWAFLRRSYRATSTAESASFINGALDQLEARRQSAPSTSTSISRTLIGRR